MVSAPPNWRFKIQKIRKNRKIESLYSTLYQLAIYCRKASEMHPEALTARPTRAGKILGK